MMVYGVEVFDGKKWYVYRVFLDKAEARKTAEDLQKTNRFKEVSFVIYPAAEVVKLKHMKKG